MNKIRRLTGDQPNQKFCRETARRFKYLYVGEEVKRKFVKAINDYLDPICQNRSRLEMNPNLILEILDEGKKKVVLIARGTMNRVKETMALSRDLLMEVENIWKCSKNNTIGKFARIPDPFFDRIWIIQQIHKE